MGSSEGRGYYDMDIDWDGAVGIASQQARAYGCLYSAGKYLVRLGKKTSTSEGMIEDLEKVCDFLARALGALSSEREDQGYPEDASRGRVECENINACIQSLLQAIRLMQGNRSAAVSRIRGVIHCVRNEITNRRKGAELR